MNNENATNAIDNCFAEIENIDRIIKGSGTLSPVSGYLTRYTLIKICGTLEFAYKTIIADYYEKFSKELTRFVSQQVRNASKNATYNSICTVLSQFDPDIQERFKSSVNANTESEMICKAMSSLNEERNKIARGNSSTISFFELRNLFNKAHKIIEILDNELADF